MSPFLDAWTVASAQRCLERCQSEEWCKYFTHYATDEQCLGFESCEDFTHASCSDCYSGASSCDGKGDVIPLNSG